jgi:hypothetical protein
MAEGWIRNAEEIWTKRQFGYVLIFVGASLTFYWLWNVPAPNYSLIAMAVAAGLMALRSEMSGRERTLWALLLIFFALVEIRAIHKDTVERDSKQIEAQKALNKNFTDIAGGISGSIASSDDQFQATMRRIQKTLDTSEATLRNTQPRAILETKSVDPSPIASIVPGANLTLGVNYTNYGPDVAREAKIGAMLYVRKPDDINAQREIAAAFDKLWAEVKHPAVVNVNFMEPRTFAFTSDKLSETEVKGLIDHTLTIYILTRYTWRDTTGNWISDQCFSMQDPTSQHTFGHSCKYHEKHRYRAKPLARK